MSTITSRPSAAATALPAAFPIYPVHYACDVVLRNGSTLHLRPIRAEDAAALQAFHQHLSPESLYLRFMSFAGATPAVAARLCTLDYANSFGFVGECGGTICAAAHYFRDDRAPERAEVAFAVADALRGQGVGTKLLERLASVAREHGIRDQRRAGWRRRLRDARNRRDTGGGGALRRSERTGRRRVDEAPVRALQHRRDRR
jgi:GNAT superfamily N-acetyltransferase